MELRFQWDARKAARNIARHGVTFDEAASAFGDPLAAIFDDDVHVGPERREILVGYSATSRVIIVAFVERTPGMVRIISAREATRTERRDHEEGTKR
jgi:uncharacterized DUF497 family protein